MRSADLPVTPEELYNDKCYDCKYLRLKRDETGKRVIYCSVAAQEEFDENFIVETMRDWCRLKQIILEMKN